MAAHPRHLEGLTEEAKCDGIFPLISNESSLSEVQLLLAYKQQPAIERRFEQMKTDFVVAPVYLKETSRIQALLCVYLDVRRNPEALQGNCAQSRYTAIKLPAEAGLLLIRCSR